MDTILSQESREIQLKTEEVGEPVDKVVVVVTAALEAVARATEALEVVARVMVARAAAALEVVARVVVE